MGLSYQWRTILKKLAEYGDEGVNEKSFCDLMGDNDTFSRGKPCSTALSQMFFTHTGYFETISPGRIRITQAGREALDDE